MNSLLKILILSHLLFLFAACGRIENSQYSEYLTTNDEAELCISNYAYPSTTKVNGVAKFFKRGLDPVVQINTTTSLPELKNLTLGDPLQEALPIRFAEVAIYNSNNSIIQCGRTDINGALRAVDGISDLKIPSTPGTYTVKVLSRTYVQFDNIPGKPEFLLDVSIKKDRYTNKLYSIDKKVFSNGIDEVNAVLTAYARPDTSPEVLGGAFNILNSIYTTYAYINNNTGNLDTQCLSERINVYWKLGFNPLQYYYPNYDPADLPSNSFYWSDSDKSINITGGYLGDSSISNTDHFDDFVIIHELGHFIEDHCGQLSPQGGTHELRARIDPRLAWHEAWGNYIASQVLFNNTTDLNPEFALKMDSAGFPTLDQKFSYLLTTYGYSDSTLNVGNGDALMADLKRTGTNPGTWQTGPSAGADVDRVDPTRFPGEGHFREGAISRALFKMTNSCGVNCATVPATFESVWRSMDSSGAGTSNLKFKGSHDVLEIFKGLNPAWPSLPDTPGPVTKEFREIAEGEALHLYSEVPRAYQSGADVNWVYYGTPLQSHQVGVCGTGFTIQPRVDDPGLSSSDSDPRYSNHYFTIDFQQLPNVNTISVKFTKLGGTDTEFDVILLQENYERFLDYTCSNLSATGSCKGSWLPARTISGDMVRYDRSSSSNFKKLTRLDELDRTKKYLLNIRAFTAGRQISGTTAYRYVIRDAAFVDTGKYICF